MDFSPTITRESKTFPGVTFTLRTMSHGRRTQMNLALAEYRAKIRELNRVREPLRLAYNAALDKAREAAEPEVAALVASGSTRADAEKSVVLKLDFPDEKLVALAESWDEAKQLDLMYLVPARVRALFASADGISCDGQPFTAESLLSDGPEELLAEIASACEELEGLTPKQRGNLQRPGTSGKSDAGPLTSTSAISAGNLSVGTT